MPCSENCSCGKNANGVKWVCLLKCLYKASHCGTDDSVSHLLLQAYFRQGVALQYLGRHADALAAFASGLAQDPKSLQLLVGMVEAAMKSPLRGKISVQRLMLMCCDRFVIFIHHHLHIFQSCYCLEACLGDNPHTLSVSKHVQVTLPVTVLPTQQTGHLSICLSFHLFNWLLVSDTHLWTLRPDARSFSISYC